jgi:hypothetical protein
VLRQDSGKKRAQERALQAPCHHFECRILERRQPPPPLFLGPFFPMSRAQKSILDHGCTL